MSTIDQLLQLIVGSSIEAGAIGIAITTFVLGDDARKLIAPTLFTVGSTSASLLLSATIISWFCIKFQNNSYLNLLEFLSYYLFLIGSFLLLFHVIYMIFRLIRINVSVEVEVN